MGIGFPEMRPPNSTIGHKEHGLVRNQRCKQARESMCSVPCIREYHRSLSETAGFQTRLVGYKLSRHLLHVSLRICYRAETY